MRWINNKWPILKRPIRAAGITFIGLSGLFGIAALLIQDIPRLLYFLLGVGYSFFLSLIGVGICLLGNKATKTIKITALLGLIMCLSIYLPFVYGMITKNFSKAMAISDIAMHAGLWICYGTLALIVAMAGMGWRQHFKTNKLPNDLLQTSSQGSQFEE